MIKRGFLSLIFVLAAFTEACAESSASKPAEKASDFSNSQPMSGLVRDWTQSLFYLLTGVLATLTYLHARKSIFTPFKTEAFKLQLKALEEVLQVFENHDDDSVIDRLNYLGCFRVNYTELHFAFRRIFHRDKVDMNELHAAYQEERAALKPSRGLTKKPYGKVGCPFGVQVNDSQTLTDLEKLSIWSTYDHDPLYTTKTFEDNIRKIRRLGTSPLLPLELLMLVRHFGKQAYKNLHLIPDLMNQAAKEFPSRSVNGPSCIAEIGKEYEALFVQKLNNLGDEQAAILEYVYKYLQVEKIMPRDMLIESLKSPKVKGFMFRFFKFAKMYFLKL